MKILTLEQKLAPHVVVFVACAGILFFAFFLNPIQPGNPYLSIFTLPLPDTCTFNNLTGLPCPGCGLTRSLVAAIHGDISGSLTFHRLGLLTLFYILLQFLYRLGCLLLPRQTPRLFGSGRLLNRGIIYLGILFAANWLITLSRFL
jgi:hypothetical protein